MATTIRQLIMTNLKSRLQGITVAGGYETGVGARVYEWREYAIEESEMPAIVIRDREMSYPEPGYNVHDNVLTVTISTYAGGTTTTEDLRKVRGDIINCISKDLTFGGYAYDVEPGGEVMTQIHEETRSGDDDYTIMIKYHTPAWNPYTVYTI